MGGEWVISGFLIKHLGQLHEWYFMVFLSFSLKTDGSALH